MGSRLRGNDAAADVMPGQLEATRQYPAQNPGHLFDANVKPWDSSLNSIRAKRTPAAPLEDI
jgi:hypothetical protein